MIIDLGRGVVSPAGGDSVHLVHEGVAAVQRFSRASSEQLVPLIAYELEKKLPVTVLVLLHARQRVDRIIIKKRIHAALPDDG